MHSGKKEMNYCLSSLTYMEDYDDSILLTVGSDMLEAVTVSMVTTSLSMDDVPPRQ